MFINQSKEFEQNTKIELYFKNNRYFILIKKDFN